MTKTFLLSLVVVMVLGISWGLAFAGGVALGKSQSDDVGLGRSSASLPFSPRQESSVPTDRQPSDQVRQQFGSGGTSQQQLDQLRQRFRSGEINPEDLDQLRERFRSGEINPEDLDQLRQRFSGRFGQGIPSGGGVTGIVEEVEGNILTVDTSQGALQATINDETVVQKFAEGTLEDLQAGVRVTVIGQPGEDGAVEARSILITPAGAGGFGGGFFSGDRQQQDQESP